MVPGSTFRYGSNFCSVTLRPRLSSRQPRLAAAIPLPKEETTPPVTKIYFDIWFNCPPLFIHHQFFVEFRHSCPILGRIDAQRFVLGFNHSNLKPVLERAQLLQPFGLFERADREIGIVEQEIAAIDVESNVLEERVGRGAAR